MKLSEAIRVARAGKTTPLKVGQFGGSYYYDFSMDTATNQYFKARQVLSLKPRLEKVLSALHVI